MNGDGDTRTRAAEGRKSDERGRETGGKKINVPASRPQVFLRDVGVGYHYHLIFAFDETAAESSRR